MLLTVIGAWVTTGVPVRWGIGMVTPGSCRSFAKTYACRVELVPSGDIVSARSDRAVPGGGRVKLRVWHLSWSSAYDYAIVEVE